MRFASLATFVVLLERSRLTLKRCPILSGCVVSRSPACLLTLGLALWWLPCVVFSSVLGCAVGVFL